MARCQRVSAPARGKVLIATSTLAPGHGQRRCPRPFRRGQSSDRGSCGRWFHRQSRNRWYAPRPRQRRAGRRGCPPGRPVPSWRCSGRADPCGAAARPLRRSADGSKPRQQRGEGFDQHAQFSVRSSSASSIALRSASPAAVSPSITRSREKNSASPSRLPCTMPRNAAVSPGDAGIVGGGWRREHAVTRGAGAGLQQQQKRQVGQIQKKAALGMLAKPALQAGMAAHQSAAPAWSATGNRRKRQRPCKPAQRRAAGVAMSGSSSCPRPRLSHRL